MAVKDAIQQVAQAFEAIGTLILVLGLGWSVVLGVRSRLSAGGLQGLKTLRVTFGRALLLGLEILVAAGIIHTVAVAPTLKNVAALGLIVLIRTFLSFSLQIEVEGSPPWRHQQGDGGKSSQPQATEPGQHEDR